MYLILLMLIRWFAISFLSLIAQNLIVYGSFTTGPKILFAGGQFGPDSTGQFRPD
jgi:hypothetical protein